MIKILTAGDSHGYGLIGIIEGLPSHIKVDVGKINEELFKRQHVYGRGKRMSIEDDRVQILSGLWESETTGAPLTLFIKNKSKTPPNRKMTTPRPGHADFSGMLKYDFRDARIITERASARRTAMDVAIGGLFKQILENVGIKVWSYTVSIGNVELKEADEILHPLFLSVKEHPLLCPDSLVEKAMMREVDKASKRGYTLGGKVRIYAAGLPVGLGTYNSYESRLTSILAKSLFDIPTVRGVIYGDIEKTYTSEGTNVMDEIVKGGKRKTNHAGGIEGGMSNGEDLEVSLMIKAIPTQARGLKTIDMNTDKETRTIYVRSDTCAVAAISVIAAAKVATILGKEIIEEFYSPSFREVKEKVKVYMRMRREVLHRD